MKTAPIFIFEDDPVIATSIKYDLSKQGYLDITISTNLVTAIQVITNSTFALAILDIHTEEDPEAGLRLAKILERYHTPYILSTGKHELEGKILELDPKAVLIKPYNKRNLIMGVEMALKNKITPEESTAASSETPKTAFIKQNKVFEGVRYEEISYAKTDHGCIRIFSKRKEFTVTSSLNHFQQELDNSSFLRIDKYLLVNLHQIESFSQEGIIFRDGYKTPVSRSGFLKLKEFSFVIYTKK